MKRFNAFICSCVFLLLAVQAWAAPAAPVMTYSTSGLDLTINWTEVEGATGYILYYTPYPYSGQPEDILSSDRGNVTSFGITLWEGAAYHIAIAAYDASGTQSGYSNIGQFTVTTHIPPEAPQLHYGVDGTSISIGWDPVDNATGYILNYMVSNSDPSAQVFTPLDLNNQTSFSYNNLQIGSTYTIGLQAYNDYGTSDFSNTETFTVLDPLDVDDDGDGYTENQGDCDDSDPLLRPYALSVGSEGNILEGFPGQNVSEEVNSLATEEISLIYSFISGPPGMTIDAQGFLTYTIPPNANQESQEMFQIEATPSTGGCVSTLTGVLQVLTVEHVASGSVGSLGGMVSDEQGQIVVEVPSGAVSSPTEISITSGSDSNGNKVISIKGSADIERAKISLPKSERLTNVGNEISLAMKAQSTSSQEQLVVPASSNVLAYGRNWFYGLGGTERVSDELHDLIDNGNPLQFKEQASFQVVSSSGLAGIKNKTAVLFIHGYTRGNSLGGGRETWGVFPERLQAELGENYFVCEFQWRTNARFQDVAEDLRSAVELLEKLTHKKVHIVAHSFGGLLARTYLQGFANEGGPLERKKEKEKYTVPVASLTTIGTPHSGIAGSKKEMHGVSFPKGQDNWINWVGGQVSMHQAGENAGISISKKLENLVDARDKRYLAEQEGEVVAALAKEGNSFLENIPVQVLIGLAAKEDHFSLNGFTTRSGDGLISFDGQRFHPEWALGKDSQPDKLGATVTERVLGNLSPETNYSYQSYWDTYSHSPAVDSFLNFGLSAEHNEANVVNFYEDHLVYKYVRDWIKATPRITQTPTSGSAGTVFIQSGTGFSPNGTATLHFKKPDGTEYAPQLVQIDSSGHFEETYTVESNKPAGTYTWWAVDNTSGAVSSIITYNITSAINYAMSGMIHSGSNTGSFLSGATITIAGNTTTSNSTGAFTITGVPAGTHEFTVSKPGYVTYTNSSYSLGSSQSNLHFYLVPMSVGPVIILSPPNGYIDTLFGLSGTGFTPNGTVTVEFSNPYHEIPPRKVQLDPNGDFNISLTINEPGLCLILVTDDATSDFDLTMTLVTLNLVGTWGGAPRGIQITITGQGQTVGDYIYYPGSVYCPAFRDGGIIEISGDENSENYIRVAKGLLELGKYVGRVSVRQFEQTSEFVEQNLLAVSITGATGDSGGTLVSEMAYDHFYAEYLTGYIDNDIFKSPALFTKQ